MPAKSPEPGNGRAEGNRKRPVEEPVGAVAAERHPRTDYVVFGITAALTIIFVAWGVFSTRTLASTSSGAFSWMVSNLGWGFVLAATGFVIFALWLAFSRYGSIPLGKENERPEFNTVSWIAMMFSAGMGIGLMFFGVSEPLSHFVEPPPGTAPATSDRAVQAAMSTSLFHWTLHPWAIYAVVGLAIAYGSFRRGRKQLISSVFTPLLGERRCNGPIGKLIDILALFATLFGSAASLGLGTLQIQSGMQASGWISRIGTTLMVLIIVVLTICFIISAISGIARGIQWLSNINMVLAAILAVFLFVVGPTVFILNLLPTALGDYFRDFADNTARSAASGGPATNEWLSSWTLFYWAWWISWTPFVGTFIARISRGRTIRQFIGGVILVPSLVSLVWFAILGGTAINTQRRVDVFSRGSEEAHMFGVLQTLPLTLIVTLLVMVLVAIFFVSGADAAAVVMSTLSQKGSIKPMRWMVVFWGAATGAVAAIMLVVGGQDALSGVQNLTFLAAAPFTIVMIVLCVALAKDLYGDPIMHRAEKGAEALEQAVVTGTRRHGEEFELEVTPTEDETPPSQPRE